jgi:HKD family nuclease
MDLLLHTPGTVSKLSGHYERAFKNATELFVVTAYLTEWDSELVLNPECGRFRVIIGSDFGITRKAACEEMMRWLPPNRKGQFLVADHIGGFHPKAIFWKEKGGGCFAVVGSSNLTRAAFQTNYEANVFCKLSEPDYIRGKKWVKEIEKLSVVVSEDWLKQYKEATPKGTRGTKRPGSGSLNGAPVMTLVLPSPTGMEKRIESRRKQLAKYQKQRKELERLFRSCARNEVSSEKFYQMLPTYWSEKVGDRLQGRGFEIKGKHGDFQTLSRSFVSIVDATDEDRDDVVSEEIDQLCEQKIPTRGAFLSEMLCLRFPNEYPVLCKPVWEHFKAEEYKAPRNSSEGANFIFLAKALRSSLLQNPKHPAKNLAELDTVIKLAYEKRDRSGS